MNRNNKQILDITKEAEENKNERNQLKILLIAVAILLVCSIVLSIIGIVLYDKIKAKQEKISNIGKTSEGQIVISNSDGTFFITPDEQKLPPPADTTGQTTDSQQPAALKTQSAIPVASFNNNQTQNKSNLLENLTEKQRVNSVESLTNNKQLIDNTIDKFSNFALNKDNNTEIKNIDVSNNLNTMINEFLIKK